MENKEKKIYYVCMQTQTIKDKYSSYSNFKEWKVKITIEQKQELQKLLNGNDIYLIYKFLYDVLDEGKTFIERLLNEKEK